MPRHRSGRHGHKGDSVLPRRSSHEQDVQTPVEDSPRGRPAQTHQHGRPHSPQSRRQDKVARRSKLNMAPSWNRLFGLTIEVNP